MYHLFVGVGQVTLLLRHAQSLKDKRQVIKSIAQKLRNDGFSVTEGGPSDDPKRGVMGFSYAGNNHGNVEKAMREGLRLFVGNFQVAEKHTDIFDYTDMSADKFDIETFDEEPGR